MCWTVPREGSHCCLAERKPRQSQKYLNTTKKASKRQRDAGTKGKWSILRFWTKAEHHSAPSCPAEHSLVRLSQEGCGTVKARAGFSQAPSECRDGWVILLCHWDREEKWVTEESGIIRETWKSHFRDASNELNNSDLARGKGSDCRQEEVIHGNSSRFLVKNSLIFADSLKLCFFLSIFPISCLRVLIDQSKFWILHTNKLVNQQNSP